MGGFDVLIDLYTCSFSQVFFFSKMSVDCCVEEKFTGVWCDLYADISLD